jgi:flavin-dependent thymidylate synthase
MKVSLLSHTPEALTLLLKTKGTRLAHDSDPATWSEEKRQEHLEYMRDTIKSSWEFVDYTFKIEGVTRAFTHQLVRTRTGSYAQEAMRVVDASEHPVDLPPSIEANPEFHDIWDRGVHEVMDAYSHLLSSGASPQDARGLLPTNITTSIIAKFNLRGLSEMAKLRLCTRTQGEYQNVFRMMRELVCEVHPWAREFIDVYCAAHGACAFPRYGKVECPLYKYVIPHERIEATRQIVRMAADSERYEAAPVAQNGMAM